ncbi:MAG: hypothetical protein WC538_24130 [Thermoanaerobaculia bacterium]
MRMAVRFAVMQLVSRQLVPVCFGLIRFVVMQFVVMKLVVMQMVVMPRQ